MKQALISDFASQAKTVQAGPQLDTRLGGAPAQLGGVPAFADGLPFMRPTLPPSDRLLQPIREILNNGMLTKGGYLEAFEERADFHDAKKQ